MIKEKRKLSRILVAIDGSEHSIKAAEYAIDIAKQNNAELIGLAVIDISKISYTSAVFMPLPLDVLKELERRRKEAQEWLDKVGQLASEVYDDYNSNNDPKFTTQIEKSISVEGTIVGYAENQNIDLIVVGSRGRSAFTKLLLGSVASKVVTYAHCPVLVTK